GTSFVVGRTVEPATTSINPASSRNFIRQVVAAEMLQLLAVAGQALLQPVTLGAEVALDIGCLHADNPVAALLQPGFSRRAVGDNSFRLGRIDQLDRKPMP